MDKKRVSEKEMDAIGEVLNISLGSSATAISKMLNAKVDITTPEVSVVNREEFDLKRVEPAIGVEITYVSGLEGKNVMLLKKQDVKVIVDMLMGMETPDEEFELNEMNTSAVCEVMNQMMGASSTALSEFLGRVVNISTPVAFHVDSDEELIEKYNYFVDEEYKIIIKFTLRIADKLESEFYNVMSIELARTLIADFAPDGYIDDDEELEEVKAKEEEPKAEEAAEPEALKAPEAPPVQTPPPAQTAPPPASAQTPPPMQAAQMQTPPPQMQAVPQMQAAAGGGMPMQGAPMMQGGGDMFSMQMQMMQQMQAQMAAMQQQLQSQPKLIQTQPVESPNLHVDNTALPMEQPENMELIMGVPLEISVEIGRTQKLVKDILEFTKGSLVVLDKLAGETVDLYVNGQCIAKGDVVVVEDNFGIRITEIMKINLPILS